MTNFTDYITQLQTRLADLEGQKKQLEQKIMELMIAFKLRENDTISSAMTEAATIAEKNNHNLNLRLPEINLQSKDLQTEITQILHQSYQLDSR